MSEEFSVDIDPLATILPLDWKENTILLQNVVATATFNRSVDLDEFAWRFKGEFTPSVFAATQIKLKHPPVTGLVFSTGKLVITGAFSESSAFVHIHTFYNMLMQVHPDIVIKSAQIQNLVANTQLRKFIRIDALAKAYPISTHYAPSLFPGLRFKLHDPKSKALIFVKGRIVLTGCSNRADVIRAYQQIMAIVEPFCSDEEVKHEHIATAIEANKKQRIREQDEDEEDVF
jgi:transcription initiation factor TFIID TATA-box-binding protein